MAKGQYGFDTVMMMMVLVIIFILVVIAISLTGCTNNRGGIENALPTETGRIADLRESEQLSAYLRTELPDVEELKSLITKLDSNEKLKIGIESDDAIEFLDEHPEVAEGTYAGFLIKLSYHKDSRDAREAFNAVTRALFYREDSNWMPTSTTLIRDGQFTRREPHRKNRDIIRKLDDIKPGVLAVPKELGSSDSNGVYTVNARGNTRIPYPDPVYYRYNEGWEWSVDYNTFFSPDITVKRSDDTLFSAKGLLAQRKGKVIKALPDFNGQTIIVEMKSYIERSSPST